MARQNDDQAALFGFREDDAMEEQSNADLRIHSEVTRIWGEWVGMDPT
ncbi:hypothetical protein HCA61_21470 [Rhodococcus sp. HNM0563]|nr:MULTISPECIES: hypothetical protein [unclassified Rhodococcus (in: high G+C Gram-positive bacteria)]MCK0093474.1 hypothetical protein [Rhodococcus sp. F64268]NLU64812.1 hypothetical protein [Rhodococcus sp. HNM0563]